MKQIPYSSASERNQEVILDKLKELIPQSAVVLEIGSGTGQHAVFFTRKMSGLLWQPTDRIENLSGLEACFDAEGNKNILPLLRLDVLQDPWPAHCYDAAFSANTAHIMPWEAVVAMFAGVAAHLATGSRFCLYGPFNIDNNFTSESNAQFDAHLRAEDSKMGIRDMMVVESLARLHHMQLELKIPMPANNFLLVFKRS
jgi:cyclopropane fatty-acyl-phospholipid synthase-like methyltransferase